MADNMLEPLLNRCFYKPEVALALESAPGCGKTAMIRDWCEQNNIPLVTLIASTMDETDLGGLPSKDGDEVTYLNPKWLRKLGNRGVLFLDEINTARKEVQDTLLNLIQTRILPNGTKLSDGVLIIAAMNPAEMCDNYEMSPAMRSRFMWCKLVDSAAKHYAWVTGQDLSYTSNIPAPVKYITFKDWLNRFRHDPEFEADKKALYGEALRLGFEFTAEDCVTDTKIAACRRSMDKLLYWTANAYEMVKWAPAFIDDNNASILASVNLEAIDNVANSVFKNSNRKTVEANDEEKAYSKSQSNILGRIDNAVNNS